MAGKKQKQEGVGAWIAIVILFAVGLWPIALVMLLVKLFGMQTHHIGEISA